MSAITGIYSFDQDNAMIEHGSNLMESLQKFPANDSQIWMNDEVFLGCHAQWITPESIGEKLPYYDHDRQLVITADAIIDNRCELFDKLQVDQSRRGRMPDSELILLAYQKWGDEAPNYLIGDFAFMIWDEKKRRLFGARDFSGARTLYYCHTQSWFSFCTTIEPLLSLPYVAKKLNEQWLAEFLAIPSMVDAADIYSTVYQNIKQLPPSHTISVSNGRVQLFRYCTLSVGEKLSLKSNGEYEEAFRDVFGSAVSARLRTHRNVGAHLSGGLDSSSVVSFAAPALLKMNKRLYTYSYVPVDDFKDWTPKNRQADERPFIQSVVQHVGNITDQYLPFEGQSPLTEIDDWLDSMEMPYKFYANSFWLKGIFETAHQQGVGVLLNGQRGNTTISWGHALDYQVSLLKRLRWIRLYRELYLYSQNTGIGKSRILAAIRKKAFPADNRQQTPETMLINTDFAKRMNVFDKLQEHGMDITGSPTWKEFRKKHFEQLFHWNINGTYATKLSLRYSVWDRDPTNDLRVVRFCLSVPDEQYVQDGLDRALIRRSTKGYLPDKVRLNLRIRGIQGADGVHRMTASWKVFIEELDRMSKDSGMSELLNIKLIKSAIEKIKETPRPEYVYDSEFSLLMRSLIVYRFIKKNA